MISFVEKIEKKILLLVIFLFTLFSYLTIQPINMGDPANATSLHGKLDRHVLRVIRFAEPLANKTFSESKNHFLYHDRNPGMFKFISELGYRLNLDMPYDLQLIMILLGILGIVFQFYWIKEYFEDPLITTVTLLFLIVTPFQTNFGITTHQQPYDFLFFNLCLFSFVRYLKLNQRKYWYLALLSYFFLCQNYYMFYVSTFIIIVGMSWIAKKEFKKNFLAFSLVPVLSVFLLTIQVVNQFGGIDVAYQKMKSILMHRVMDEKRDEKVENVSKKMEKKDWITYPITVSKRVERYYFLPLPFYLLMLIFIRKWARKRNIWEQDYKILKYLFVAGISWYLIMFQHTSVHVDSGRYSYFIWMFILAFFIKELWLSELTLIKKKIIASILILIFGGYGFGLLYLNRSFTYLKNIYSFNKDLHEADQGNKLSLYRLLSNEFFTELNQAKPYLNKIRQLDQGQKTHEGLTLLDQLYTEQEAYLVFKATKKMNKVKSLGIKHSEKWDYFEFDYPNLQPKMWKKKKYFVLKIPFQSASYEFEKEVSVLFKNSVKNEKFKN